MEVLDLVIDILNLDLSTCLEVMRSSSLSSVPTRVYIILPEIVVMILLLGGLCDLLFFALVLHVNVGLSVLRTEVLADSSLAEPILVHLLIDL